MHLISVTVPHRLYFYGYKLHGICSIHGVFHSIDLTKASVHDNEILKDLNDQLSDTVLIGDKGYIGKEMQLDLFETTSIKLHTPMRNNQHDYKPFPYIFKKVRKRLETLFSQLCDQFMVRRDYAKTFTGFRTRILSKITALTPVAVLKSFRHWKAYQPIKTCNYLIHTTGGSPLFFNSRPGICKWSFRFFHFYRDTRQMSHT